MNLVNTFKKDPLTLKSLFLEYFLKMNVGLSAELSLAKLMIFWQVFIYKKYVWTRENGMFNPNFSFKDNVHLIGQGIAKLALPILAAINGNVTSQTTPSHIARGKSIIINYENAVLLSFKNDNFPKLPSPALPNHHSARKNVRNPAPNIIKPVSPKK